MTYFVKGYGYHENGSVKKFSIIFDLDVITAKSFTEAVAKEANLSPFRNNKELVIEEVVVLSYKDLIN